MLRVGLTGGIGSGKSAVAARLAAWGGAVVDADAVAREVVEPGTPGLGAVVAAFGEGVLVADGSLDRPALGRLVFADEQARQRLGAITHPLIAARSAELVAEAEAAGARVLVHDVPLLVESGLESAFDVVVVVEAPLPLRLTRLAARGLAEDDARARIASQATDGQRRAVATYLVDNTGSLTDLDARVELLWQALIIGHDPEPVELPATKGEVRRVGERLGAAGAAGAHDLDLLDRWLLVHDTVRSRVQARVRAAADAPVRARVKTRDTLLAKLDREPGVDLANVQDLAGVRVVVPGGRAEQDTAVASVRRALPGEPQSKVYDRRDPGRDSSGYRAVHMVARLDGLQVEVQVRTRLQHRWAELSEKIADRWGRQLRYGADPDQPSAVTGLGTRREAVGLLRGLADLIAAVEALQAGGSQVALAERLLVSVDDMLALVHDALLD